MPSRQFVNLTTLTPCVMLLQNKISGETMNNTSLKIYFAGDLFDHKDLAGNLLLANAIEEASNNRYKIMLPQDGECEVVNRTSQSIRDADFKLLFNCDLIVANFDGHDLDSGTVVEFCFAKMLDIPALLLRTDFRHSGDNTLPDTEPWNLMCSHYPRTRVLHLNAMELYHNCRAAAGQGSMLKEYYTRLAVKCVAELDAVTSEPSWLKKDQLASQFRMVLNAVGGTVKDLFPDNVLDKLIEQKSASTLYD